MAKPFDWLPQDQDHVLGTLAHVDQLIGHIGDVLFEFLNDPGPLGLREVRDATSTRLLVDCINPVPLSLSRTAADVLNGLRSAVEHTLIVEVARAEGRELTAKELQAIEMPAKENYQALTVWAKHRHRASLACLGANGQVRKRIEMLQPYQRSSAPADHPLALLAAYTNQAKHRAPIVAASLVGRVDVERGNSTAIDLPEPRFPQVGDVLSESPPGEVAVIAVWPQISLKRPTDGSWRVLMHELRDIEEWVRKIAIPTLVTGAWDIVPNWVPSVSVNIGHLDLRGAVAASKLPVAAARGAARIRGVVARTGLVETLSLVDGAPSLGDLARWAEHLDDDYVIGLAERLGRTAQDKPDDLPAFVDELLDEARLYLGSDPASADS